MIVTARIDRPLGSRHPRHPEMIYPVNYGEVVGVMAPDGDWQDVYVLGVNEALSTFTGRGLPSSTAGMMWKPSGCWLRRG